MRRLPVLALIVFAVSYFISGCGGSNAGTPTKLVFLPTTLALGQGQVGYIIPEAEDSLGNIYTSQTYTFSSNRPTCSAADAHSSQAICTDVSQGGLVCGGTWDSETNPVVCCPGYWNSTVSQCYSLPNLAGIGTITVTDTLTNNKTITGSYAVYVHPPVAQVAVCRTPTGGCASAAGTNSSGTAVAAGTIGFTATACSTFTSGACPNPCPDSDVTAYVGPFSWTVTPATVGIADTTGASCTNSSFTGSCSSTTACYTCNVTAGTPGMASVIAAVQGVASLPGATAAFETCPVQSIALSDSSTGTNTGTTAPVSVGTTVALKTVVTDSAGIILSNVTPAYNSSQPAAVSPSVNSAAIAAGDSNIVASCTPPTCNNGFYPIFSNPYLIDVSGASTTTVLVASSTAPPSGTSSYLIPISTSTNTVGTAIALPNTPNSMIANEAGTKVLLGSNNPGTTSSAKQGVMVLDVSTTSLGTTGFWGKVLAISPDGDKAIIFDPGPTPPTTFVPTLYIYSISENSASSVPMSNAVHAAFTPDSSRAYIVGTNGGNPVLVVVAPGTTPVFTTLTATANDVDFLVQGSIAYLAGGNFGSGGTNIGVETYATCNSSALAGGGVMTPGTPSLIRTVPNALGAPPAGSAFTTYVVAADSPDLDVFATTLPAPVGAGCPVVYSNTGVTPVTWSGVSAFQANQLLVTPNSQDVFILPGVAGSSGTPPNILEFTISGLGTSGFGTREIPLKSSTATTILTGGITLDSASLYLGADDGMVHQIDVSTLTDATQIPVTFTGCSTSTTTCYPDLVAVIP